MNDENNVFDSNDQTQQPPYDNQGQDGGPVRIQKDIPSQNDGSQYEIGRASCRERVSA